MASKYAQAIIGLQIMPEDPTYQEKINQIKAELKPELMTPELMAERYAILRTAKDDLKDQLEIIQAQLTAVEQMLVTSYTEDDDPGWGLYGAGPNMVKRQDGSSVAVQIEPAGQVIDKEAFRLWCIANGLENSLQLWPTTMNSIVKERALNMEPIPDGVKVFAKPKIVWRKG